MAAIDEIKNNINIIDLVSETVKLRRTGKNYIGFCPFHSNTRTPAFVVFPDSGTWRCFGQCAEGGDIFSYLMKRDGLDFQQALQTLAKRAGVELEDFKQEDPSAKEARERLYQLMEDASEFYQNNLLLHPAGRAAYQYLEKRGITRATMEKFRMGYAPESWDATLQHLLSKGYTREEVTSVGLVSEKRDEKGDPIPDGRIYDRFRNRIMIPICDSTGKLIAFGARILDPNDVPKFLNSPQTVLFDKGKTLFGLNHARRTIREKDQAVIVEGYLDVIVLHQAGFTNTVSPMGTALGEFQVRQLARQSNRIILALDADAAGDNATRRGIDMMRDALKGEIETTGSDGRTLIRQESKLHTDIRITKIPEGMDPDEVVLRNPEEWQAILDQAKPIVLYMMDVVSEGKNLEDGKVKREIADQILPLIFEVPDPIERETYRQQLARHLKISETLLQYSPPPKGQSVKGGGKKKAVFPEKPQLDSGSDLIFDPKAGFYSKEMTILQYLYNFYDLPGSFSNIDRVFRRFHLMPLLPDDFDQSDLRQIADWYFQGIDQDDELNTKKFIREHIPDSVAGTFEQIENPNFQGSVNLVELDKDLARSIAFLRNEKCVFSIIEIQTLCGSVGETDPNLSEFRHVLDHLIIERNHLENVLKSLSPKFI